MFAASSAPARRNILVAIAATSAFGIFMIGSFGLTPAVPSADAQEPVKNTPDVPTVTDMHEPAFEPLANEPAARIVIDPPLAGPLARGVVVIQYRTENMRILPVFGSDALKVSPRIGHLHVTVDDAPWHLAIASVDPLIIAGLPAGPHKMLIELADANHHVLDKAVVAFVVPKMTKPVEGALPAKLGTKADDASSPIFGVKIPDGYRQWELISISEAQDNNELKAIFGNGLSMKAYRDKTLPFPDGSTLVKLTWKREPLAGFDGAFVPGPATMVQVMVKESKKYAATGGWGFGRFVDGKAVDEAQHKTCFACHSKNKTVKEYDYVFTHFAP